MKLAGFNALCRREMEAEDPGEVAEVSLTADSLRELSAEALSDESAVTILPPDVKPGDACGGRVSHAVHPVTGLAVPVSLGDGPDTATVRCGQDGSLMRMVAIQ